MLLFFPSLMAKIVQNTFLSLMTDPFAWLPQKLQPVPEKD